MTNPDSGLFVSRRLRDLERQTYDREESLKRIPEVSSFESEQTKQHHSDSRGSA